MIQWVNPEITEILKKILNELDIKIQMDNSKDKLNLEAVNFVAFNTFEKLKEKDSYVIDFDMIYKLIPVFSYIEKIYDVDVPSSFPIGGLSEEVKNMAFTIKSILYNYILSVYFPEIVWNYGECEIYLPEEYLK